MSFREKLSLVIALCLSQTPVKFFQVVKREVKTLPESAVSWLIQFNIICNAKVACFGFMHSAPLGALVINQLTMYVWIRFWILLN